MEINGSPRDALRPEPNDGYSAVREIQSSQAHVNLPDSMGSPEVATKDLRDVSQPQKYAGAATSAPSVVETLFERHQGTTPPQLHHRALIIPDSQNMAVFEPQSLTITLTSHRQPYGCREPLIYAPLPRRAVLANQWMKILISGETPSFLSCLSHTVFTLQKRSHYYQHVDD